ncbi:hypothetical protein Q7C36_013642 [Tachysurus vachellii]|uniref:Uncharacterized protein n=1 Tax=Tachysurus vachellii TaxID=175792 RepID=A0AA88MIW5_TACVA|nr:hypothetical protein Q7C36_013642 [Tachysurus vachellii]
MGVVVLESTHTGAAGTEKGGAGTAARFGEGFKGSVNFGLLAAIFPHRQFSTAAAGEENRASWVLKPDESTQEVQWLLTLLQEPSEEFYQVKIRDVKKVDDRNKRNQT